MTIMWIFILTTFIANAYGRPSYPGFVPNGGNVEFDGGVWLQLGHLSRDASGNNLNPFGRDVRTSLVGGLPDWSSVCNIDSDGDGKTNGEELLDPNCEWRSSQDNNLLVSGIATHPGFADGEKPPDTPLKIKLHAAFMTLAWLFFAPVGVLTAVVLKVKTKSVTKVNWFKIHKACVGTAVYLTLIAYICMVYEREDFLFNNRHTKFGHSVIILALIQPLSGLYRIHINKDGSKTYLRLAWEYFHQFTGRILLILAAAALYLGYDISNFVEDSTRTVMQIIVLGVLIIASIFCIGWVFIRKDERKEPELPTKQEEKKEKKKEEKKKEEKKEKGEMPKETQQVNKT